MLCNVLLVSLLQGVCVFLSLQEEREVEISLRFCAIFCRKKRCFDGFRDSKTCVSGLIILFLL